MEILTKHTTANNPILKIVAMVLFIVFPIIGFVFGMQYQRIIDLNKNTSSIECYTRSTAKQIYQEGAIDKNGDIQSLSSAFNLNKLRFPELPSGYILKSDKDGNKSDTIYIEKSAKEFSEIITQINILPPKTEEEIKYPYRYGSKNVNSNKSKFGEISFLGTKYPFYVDKNVVHGDGPALNPGGCSNSTEGDTHSILTKENVLISIDEITSTSYCGSKVTKSVRPTQSEVEMVFKFIEGITFSASHSTTPLPTNSNWKFKELS